MWHHKMQNVAPQNAHVIGWVVSYIITCAKPQSNTRKPIKEMLETPNTALGTNKGRLLKPGVCQDSLKKIYLTTTNGMFTDDIST